mmetsp:Transcript_75272/g.176661  ORF Transcript_75272/g.176661 Transcript_75272/m.176661 type:complete len:136 (-) Transcript_75272:623-1030(-)
MQRSNQGFQCHACLCAIKLSLIILGEGFRLGERLLNLLSAKEALLLDDELAAFARILAVRFHSKQAIFVHLEKDLDLRHSSWGCRDAFDLEASQEVVIASHPSLALEDFDAGHFLTILVGREEHRVLGWQLRVPI